MATFQLFWIPRLTSEHCHRRTEAMFAAKFVLRRTSGRHRQIYVSFRDRLLIHNFLQHLLKPAPVALYGSTLPVSEPLWFQLASEPVLQRPSVFSRRTRHTGSARPVGPFRGLQRWSWEDQKHVPKGLQSRPQSLRCCGLGFASPNGRWWSGR